MMSGDCQFSTEVDSMCFFFGLKAFVFAVLCCWLCGNVKNIMALYVYLLWTVSLYCDVI